MRRRDPDGLTDREREVLELLRRDFTNEQIAHRLGITLDGAKYHVSQILSKLGVANREEAAAFAHGERRRWWTRWPLWAKVAGAATVAAAVAGLGLLAWGTFETQTHNQATLRMCVDGVSQETAAAAAHTLGQAGEALHRQDELRDISTAYDDVLIQLGCPVDIRTELSDEPSISSLASFSGVRVDTASGYRVFVVVLPEDYVTQAVSADGIQWANAETVCEPIPSHQPGQFADTVCSPVSNSIFLSPDQASDQTFLLDALRRVLGHAEWVPPSLP